MRVIAGKYRSRPLRSLRGMDIRPTADRLREALFNVLTAGAPDALAGSVWLDLFAGTGAVGIEALSRGAGQVSFVESSAPAARVVRQNLDSLGIKAGFVVVQAEVLKALKKIDEGSFGVCEECGEEISVKRLEARPETTLCIRCKEDQERMEKDYT